MNCRFLVATMLAALFFPIAVNAQTSGSVEDIQIRSIDFDNQIMEIFNFGSSTWSLDGWRLCTHDETQGFQYTTTNGLNGQSLSSGDSLFFHWNNDATNSDSININSLGSSANWIDELTADSSGEAVSIGLYRTGPFGNADNLVDHIQYSYLGANVGGANGRGSVATTAGLWSATTDWISTDTESTGLLLTDDPFPGATGGTHGSGSYAVLSTVPEPSSLAIFGLASLAFTARRRRRA